jgi:anti-anti-sigma regulatory factor
VRIPIRFDPAGAVTLLLAGTINANCVADFDRALESARHSRRPVVLDLSKVRLIDRPALHYLIDVAGEGVHLANCPAHVERWIVQLSEDEEEEQQSD